MYRIYSRISRGFLDNLLIRKVVGRQIKIYNMKQILGYKNTKHYRTLRYTFEEFIAVKIMETFWQQFLTFVFTFYLPWWDKKGYFRP